MSAHPIPTALATGADPSVHVPGGPAPLSIAACRRLLGPECGHSDEEILANRDRLLALAHALLDLAEERERR